MKNLLNLGKALNKAEQKAIHGGDFGDVGLPDVGPDNDSCQVHASFTPPCLCEGQGGIWNSECNRCETANNYFAGPGCSQIPVR